MPVITLTPYDPIDIDPSGLRTDITAVYLVRNYGSREAWLICFERPEPHAVLWWLPAEHRLAWPYLKHSGWSIGSPYPDAPYWWISGRFVDALEYIWNGIRVQLDKEACPWSDPDECSTARERSVAGTSRPIPACPVHEEAGVL